MVGTALDGQLTSPVAVRTRARFAVATRAHDAAIRRLLRENPMRGAISLTLEREPDYFAGADIADARDQTIVAFEDERLVCMGRCSTRTVWINGQVRRAGYLAELRLDASARGRFDLVRDGYRFFRSVHATNPADVYFTSIAADNGRARRLLERGAPGLPRYTHLGDLTTLLISTRQSLSESIKDALTNPDAVELPLDSPNGPTERWSELTSTRGEPPALTFGGLGSSRSTSMADAPTDDLAKFLNSSGSQSNLAVAWTPAAVASLARHDLPLTSFGVVRDAATIIAAAGLWDQRRFRQTVVRRYSRRLAYARPLINLAGKFLGVPPLPRSGGVLSHAFLSPLAVGVGADAWLIELVSAFRHRAAARGIDYLTLALPSFDCRLVALKRRFRCRAYASRIYRVQWPGQLEMALDGRAILPDVALL